MVGEVRNRGPSVGPPGEPGEEPGAAAPAYEAAGTGLGKEQEMGGTVGAVATILWSHLQILYMWYSLEAHQGKLWQPTAAELSSFKQVFVAKALPSSDSCIAYACFFVGQLTLAQFMPGLRMKGVPVAALGGKQLWYLCNAYSVFYTCLAICAALHFSGVWAITRLIDNFGHFVFITMVVGDVTSLGWYLYGLIAEKGGTGSPIYDFFMGTTLNPRIGKADVKMVAEARWSWLTLFLITVSCCVRQYEQMGRLSYELAFMLLAHWLYANACAKGEHFIVTTWDMTTEKYGWMLNFWNICGVPIVYAFSSLYLFKNPAVCQSSPLVILYAVALLGVYYVWDVSNFQKNDLRLRRIGADEARARSLFPVLPGSRLENPQTMKTPKGELLVDGMYKYARKINYMMDIAMAFLWGAVTHFTAFLPFFYCAFFTGFITHRWVRDDARCAKKYGEHWAEYKRRVPYVFIPGLF
eukprot:TRINITY_DN70098_c0_g1_i1.p1 TRINITY_DN70098_c0_g1~~TRINITY_DN70098_c0_g1_i1.p1  ORF type:complete len:491 (+),score=201.63 TRINITY_DN70098_c0_g1_i1:73-1473(+)